MMEPLSGLPDHVIGFEAIGKVHAEDYDAVVRPTLERAARAGGIRVVMVLGERFEGYSAGAKWADTKLWFSQLTAWKRTALVSDRDRDERLSSVLGWAVPGDFAHFGLDDLAAAVTWAASDAEPSTRADIAGMLHRHKGI